MPRTEKQQRDYERKKAWRQANPAKARASVDAFYQRNPGARHDRHLQRTYGLTKEEYHLMLGRQHGTCAICPAETAGRRTKGGKEGLFVVDHCHKTGKVRGLLCHACNVALALAQDDPTLLRAMADYLEANR